ncbi:hypothetical protein HK103_003633, partial [Boothiomyces macroporosus]
MNWIRKPGELKKRKYKERGEEQISSIRKSLGLTRKLDCSPSSELDGSKSLDATVGDVIINETQRASLTSADLTPPTILNCKRQTINSLQVSQIYEPEAVQPPLLAPNLKRFIPTNDHINDSDLNETVKFVDFSNISKADTDISPSRVSKLPQLGFQSFSSIPENIKSFLSGTRIESALADDEIPSGFYDSLNNDFFAIENDSDDNASYLVSKSQVEDNSHQNAAENSFPQDSIESVPLQIPLDPIESSVKFTPFFNTNESIDDFFEDSKLNAGKSKDSTTSNNFVGLLRSDITTSPSSSVSQEQNTVLPYQKSITQNGTELLAIEAH